MKCQIDYLTLQIARFPWTQRQIENATELLLGGLFLDIDC